MIKLLRSLFGLKGVAGNRAVAGTPDNIPPENLTFLQDSQRRLRSLQDLYIRYKDTAHAPQLIAALEKTQRIHTYLAAKGNLHELELFHVQHTDHFINTYTSIIEMHTKQRKQQAAPVPVPQPRASARPGVIGRTVVFGPFRSDRKEVKAARMQNRQTSQQAYADTIEAKVQVPKLVVPVISINTYSRIVYLREDISDGLTTNEIGFTSTPEEKEAFATYVASRLGIETITYVGNAMVYLPQHQPNQPAEMVPIIHWHGASYAFSLEDYRLYPVRTYKNSN